jgi:23S rRNA (cytidine1920-2'-O)/16S rRNA (cytidine1409-2'-O)-methyltransferase
MCMAPRYDVLALIKPQFELGRGRVGKGGVVRDAADRREALVAVGESALELGSAVLGFRSSGLPGPKGNRETFIWLSDPARAHAERGGGALLPTLGEESPAQLAQLALEVES